MKATFGIGLLAFSLFFAACEDPAANKIKAITAAGSTTSGTAVPAPVGESLALNPANSKLLFTGSKVTGKHEGGFGRFTGIIGLVEEKPEASSVAVEIETASVFTDTDALTKHLQTGEFFEIAKFPKATFESTRIERVSDDEYTVTGDLELHGERRSITFPATITVTADSVDVNAEFSINRKDFKILYAGKADDLVRDDVVIKLELKAGRKK